MPLGNPVVPFWNPGDSELDDVLMPQKAMNKGVSDLIAAADIHGFPIITATGMTPPTDGSGDPTKFQFVPGTLLWTSKEGGKWDRIEAADLQSALDVSVLGWIQIISIIKGWPNYLFFRGTPPSGEALKSMEASLIAQVERKQIVFGDAWRVAFRLAEKLDRIHGEPKGADFSESRLKFEWHPAAPRDRKVQAEAQAIEWTSLEVPIEQRWIEFGYEPDEIKTMKAMKENEQKRALSAMMDAARERELISPGDDDDGEEDDE